jgi:hypothetical protein
MGLFPLIMSNVHMAGSLIGSPEVIREMLELAATQNIKSWIKERTMETCVLASRLTVKTDADIALQCERGPERHGGRQGPLPLRARQRQAQAPRPVITSSKVHHRLAYTQPSH